MSSVLVAAWIAYIAFAVLIVYGLMSGELGLRGLAVALLACVLAPFATPYLPGGAGAYFSPVALVDAVLALVILKGDVRV